MMTACDRMAFLYHMMALTIRSQRSVPSRVCVNLTWPLPVSCCRIRQSSRGNAGYPGDMSTFCTSMSECLACDDHVSPRGAWAASHTTTLRDLLLGTMLRRSSVVVHAGAHGPGVTWPAHYLGGFRQATRHCSISCKLGPWHVHQLVYHRPRF